MRRPKWQFKSSLQKSHIQKCVIISITGWFVEETIFFEHIESFMKTIVTIAPSSVYFGY